MKKVVSFIICKNTPDVPAEPDGAEILYTEENRTFSEIVQNGIKQANGKYTVLCGQGFEFADIGGLIAKAGASNTDIIVFDGGTAFKTSVFKSFTPDGDRATAEILAALSSKSIEKCNIKPFTFDKAGAKDYKYSEKVYNGLALALKEFKKCKSKLAKDVYAYSVDIICTRLTYFYASAMLALRNKEIAVEDLKEFDALLKENVVLYLAMDKRFTPANLSKLRKKNFEISYITSKKFEKFLRK